jgi:hypothetical protein
MAEVRNSVGIWSEGALVRGRCKVMRDKYWLRVTWLAGFSPEGLGGCVVVAEGSFGIRPGERRPGSRLPADPGPHDMMSPEPLPLPPLPSHILPYPPLPAFAQLCSRSPFLRSRPSIPSPPANGCLPGAGGRAAPSDAGRCPPRTSSWRWDPSGRRRRLPAAPPRGVRHAAGWPPAASSAGCPPRRPHPQLRLGATHSLGARCPRVWLATARAMRRRAAASRMGWLRRLRQRRGRGRRLCRSPERRCC